jgi:hypothetical protein
MAGSEGRKEQVQKIGAKEYFPFLISNFSFGHLSTSSSVISWILIDLSAPAAVH